MKLLRSFAANLLLIPFMAWASPGADQLADQGSGAGFGKTCEEKLEQVNLNMDVPCQHSVVFMATDGCDLRDVQSFFKKP